MGKTMDDPFSGQSSAWNQLNLSTVEFLCPYCQETPDATEEMGSKVLLCPCEHLFRRDDLTTVIEYLRILDDLIQHHDGAATPFERQEIREEIHAVGVKLDAAAEQCEEYMEYND